MIESENNDESERLGESRELLMLDKEERRLVAAILTETVKTEIGRQVLKERLGSEYIQIGENLLKHISGE